MSICVSQRSICTERLDVNVEAVLPVSETHAFRLYGDRATVSWLDSGEQLESIGEATRSTLQHCLA